MTPLRQLPRKARGSLTRQTHGRPRKTDRCTALPPIPHSWVLLQGGTQSGDLLCQALQDWILHLSLVGTVEALEGVSRVQGIHLRRRFICMCVCLCVWLWKESAESKEYIEKGIFIHSHTHTHTSRTVNCQGFHQPWYRGYRTHFHLFYKHGWVSAGCQALR